VIGQSNDYSARPKAEEDHASEKARNGEKSREQAQRAGKIDKRSDA
jgi:hypothetical protein